MEIRTNRQENPIRQNKGPDKANETESPPQQQQNHIEFFLCLPGHGALPELWLIYPMTLH